jgi:thiamine biosynthesis lipoprotein ApbE
LQILENQKFFRLKCRSREEGFWKDCSDTSIDLEGIAKGYCFDKLVENLKEQGFANTYVEWGG